MNASGGVPQKISSGWARSVDFGKQSHIAITSRWKCIVPFGSPVVPEVNAMMHGSSDAVSTLSNVPVFAAASASSEPGPPSLK